MCHRIFLLSSFLPLLAAPAAAQRSQPATGPATPPSAAVAEPGIRQRLSMSELRTGTRGRALRVDGTGGRVFARLAELLSVVRQNVRVSDESERLAPDLRLYRQVADLITPVAALSGSDWQVRVSVGLGLARLRSSDPLRPQRSRGWSRGSIFIAGGLQVQYSAAPGWRLLLSLRDRLEVEPVSSARAAGRHRALRPLDLLVLSRAVGLRAEIELP